MATRFMTVDGNEAAASVAFRCNEVIAIYPITPASPMGELSDAWAAAGRKNVYGGVPAVIEMQSEGGAAGAVHGALQGGALTTTFTASQGLLLMIPNLFKIAGELSPCVIHVAARSIATHALSIFGDHSDVMAARTTGWAMLCSSSVQEAHDFALIAQAATLESRVPFLHFFDGFRTSHEVAKIHVLDDEDLRALVRDEWITAHRSRSLDPDRPVLRGSAQNPDVFFQAREAANGYTDAVPGLVRAGMERFAARTGRHYHLVDYDGHPEAERVLVVMGSGAGAAREAVRALVDEGQRVGLVTVRLFRPFPAAELCAALPSTVRGIAVLDRTKEPGAPGEPLYQDVVTALAERSGTAGGPQVIGGRFGLSSKEFTPAMAMAVLDELGHERPKRHFTVGIVDDVTHLSLDWDRERSVEASDVTRAVFYGLGSDGTVGASKSSVKIIGEGTDLFAQGYFVYDSKKAGSVTVSHLRFGPRPIESSYLVQRAGFVACHQPSFLERIDVLERAGHGATFLLNTPHGPDEVWDRLPREIQTTILERELRLFVIDGHGVAREAGLGGRINTVMQVCFFALSGLFPREEAIARVKASIEKSYAKRGATVLERNFDAVDRALAGLHEVEVPHERGASSTLHRQPPVPESAPDFVKRVTALMIAGQGDLLPVSALPVDGTFPVGTARWEKRGIAPEIPIWDPDICIQCALCSLVCPHAAIRMKVYPRDARAGAPEGFKAMPWKVTGKDSGNGAFADHDMTIQVAPDDCTGCSMCVQVCPAKSKEVARHKAIDMMPREAHVAVERPAYEHFLGLPEVDPRQVEAVSVKGSQMLLPLFEYSGACAGCGETPYLKLLTQLFGDRLVIANATGCSSIYGGNLPTTPWTTGPEGRGPAWSNSLFEDNAEFGLGMRLAYESQGDHARAILSGLGREVAPDLALPLLERCARDAGAIHERRAQVAELRRRLKPLRGSREEARVLDELSQGLVPRSVWIVGGDGWAYDIGFGGLDHVLASGRRVNLLVLDTGVYSNTGGQASKATPRAAVAKFASSGRSTRRKDLGMIAMAYGDVYVAQIAMGANPLQSVKALAEAEDYPGPSIVISYSHCIAHGIDMAGAMGHQKEATQSGFWPLYRYDPRRAQAGENPFQLDSRKPTRRFEEFAAKEARFAMLRHANSDGARELMARAQRDIDEQWAQYEWMAARPGGSATLVKEPS
jgi:pyruvate-ferredoxin/flavodoxin oxidoreductase